MGVDATQALERSVLEAKDRSDLLGIAKALGAKVTARSRKPTIIDAILEALEVAASETPAAAPAPPAATPPPAPAEPAVAVEVTASVEGAASSPASAAPSEGRPRGRGARRRPQPSLLFDPLAEPPAVAEDGAPAVETDEEPPAAWEAEAGAESATSGAEVPVGAAPAGTTVDRNGHEPGGARTESREGREGREGGRPEGRYDRGEGEGDSGNRRRRRRGRDRGQGEARFEESPVGEPVEVAGLLDLRDEGYGFLRVSGYLPSREDAYVSAKQVRQFGLRKGDHIAGACRPAGRNEKNPALLRIDAVNGGDPDAARARRKFEDLTPLFPDERLRLEDPADHLNMTARIIDLLSPIGKGQRGLIVSPPKAGKTTIMKQIARSIETNNPEVHLMVLLVDERPEEVTDMRRWVKGEVVASTFDRPADEHTHVAELAIERAKRLVEQGSDVVIILDGITRLARAYNLAAPATGRIMSGGVDSGALYPPKKFFGAARNIEEGGSLTILATALVETGSRMDEVIFEEFKGTGNMELRLDRRLAERRIYPAIDVESSSTRHEELLFPRGQLNQVWKLRRVLLGLGEGGSGAGLELLIDRMRTFRSNDEFLAEVARVPSGV